MSIKILIAEDEEITVKHLLYALEAEGYSVTGVNNGTDAFKKIQKEAFDLLITDIKMPGMDGLELLDKVKDNYPAIEVIMITGFGSIVSAVDAMRQGAVDYITKPFNIDEILFKIKKIQEKKRLEEDNVALRVSLNPPSPPFEKGLTIKGLTFIAKSMAMKRVIDVANSISTSDCSVFITGESGVGKGLVAKIIHHTSLRTDRPFLAVNCAIFTEELLASELFGHEKGAFTGAMSAKKGLMEIANNGTLFLDEIAEMSTSLQAKLLKVVEDKECLRVGGTSPVKVDVRLIAATNQNISNLISNGKFREDLYFRLNVMDIYLPPLRERKEDISPLSKYFLVKHSKKASKKISGFSKEAMDMLMTYSFPGNVRELENIIERGVILEKTTKIMSENFPQTISLFQIETIDPNRIRTIDEMSRDYAEKVLESVGNNKVNASKMLGISRSTLWRILNK